MLSVTCKEALLLNVVILNVVKLSIAYAVRNIKAFCSDCCNAKFHYAECRLC
jgi:hypothetical protein